MNAEEKLKRLFHDNWEIVGEPKELLLLLREMYLDQKKMIEHVKNNTNDEWAKNYINFRCTPVGSKVRVTIAITEPERASMNNQETEGTTNNVDPASVDRVVHTPGPWRPGRADKSYDAGIPDNAFAIFAERQHQQDCGLQGNAAVICVIAKPERMTLEDIANAKLISESPEMIKVIEIIANATGDTDLEYAQELSQEILMRLKVV